MAFVKMINEEYPEKGDLRSLVYYIFRPEKTEHGLVGGFNLLLGSCEWIIQQMEIVKEVWHKTEGRQAGKAFCGFLCLVGAYIGKRGLEAGLLYCRLLC